MEVLDKQRLRQILKQRRLAKSPHEITVKSEKMMCVLMQSSFFKTAKTIGAYSSILNEVETHLLIEACLNQHKLIALPKIQNTTMEFFKINSMKDLKKGTFNILEPQGLEKVENFDIMIIPMLGFNLDKYRIGYGKGYYDHYLKSHDCLKIGLAFDDQQIDFKTEAHDISLDYIITENRIIGM